MYHRPTRALLAGLTGSFEGTGASMVASDMVSIPGSERESVRGAKLLAPSRADERLEVTVRLRRRNPLPAAAVDGRESPAQRAYLTHYRMESDYGADPADIAAVEAFARQAGLAVVESSASRRSVILSGTVAAFSEAFNVVLQQWEHKGGTYRGQKGAVQIPLQLAGVISGVFGLD